MSKRKRKLGLSQKRRTSGHLPVFTWPMPIPSSLASRKKEPTEQDVEKKKYCWQFVIIKKIKKWKITLLYWGWSICSIRRQSPELNQYSNVSQQKTPTNYMSDSRSLERGKISSFPQISTCFLVPNKRCPLLTRRQAEMLPISPWPSTCNSQLYLFYNSFLLY